MPLPLAVPLAIAGAQGLYSAYQGYRQGERAKELERKEPADNVPTAYKQMLANQANQANNAQIAGYGQAMDNLNEQQATTLGEAKRAGTSSSNLMNVLTRLNLQGSAEKRRYAIAGEQAREQRQGQYNQGLMGQAKIQEQARQEQENAIGALRGAAKQNYYNALSTGLGAATTLYGMGGTAGAEKKMNSLADKGYSEADFGGKTLSGISTSLINSLPNRFDTERTDTMEGMTPNVPNFAPSYSPSEPIMNTIPGYGTGYDTYQSDAYKEILKNRRGY